MGSCDNIYYVNELSRQLKYPSLLFSNDLLLNVINEHMDMSTNLLYF